MLKIANNNMQSIAQILTNSRLKNIKEDCIIAILFLNNSTY